MGLSAKLFSRERDLFFPPLCLAVEGEFHSSTKKDFRVESKSFILEGIFPCSIRKDRVISVIRKLVSTDLEALYTLYNHG